MQGGGSTYVKDMQAATTLDSLIEMQQMKPAVVAFVTLPGGDSAWNVMPDFLSVTLVPLLRTKYSGTEDPDDTAIGGFSLGAAVAALTALRRPDIFGKVLAQSGAFRQRMPTQRAEPNALAAIFAASPRVQLKWYLDVGLYDNVVAGPIDEMALDESNTAGNRHFRDVLVAKGYDVVYREVGGGHSPLHWRATLPDALVSLFRP
jgi:enterochelin esterase family protein